MGITRIENAFQSGKTAFMPYMTLGYPTPEKSLNVIKALIDEGADLIELGVPFSDPLADGPTIQMATQQALDSKMTLSRCLAMIDKIRSDGVETPILMMSYANPIFTYGVRNFVEESVKVEVDGFIVPDLPPEEAFELEAACVDHELAIVYLLAPTSTPRRISLVVEKSRGFIYMVSLTGVTGVRKSLPHDLSAFVNRVREKTNKPLAVGFGISNGEQAATVATYADGVIVGSALVKCVAESIACMQKLAREIKEALE
jgi:tryptophan synthase alpha chain